MRRGVWIGGAITLALIALDAASSHIGVAWCSGQGPGSGYWIFTTRVGRVGGGYVSYGIQVQDIPPVRGFHVFVPTVPRYWFWQLAIHNTSGARAYLPLWIPTLVTAIWTIRAIARRPATPQDRCAFCGYDLRHLTSGVCPECGVRTPQTGPADSADNRRESQTKDTLAEFD
ncbi:MAG: hypothetical protein IT434_16120 [Phycisphaerales bacterium]|nr:hypothetical protein [Phycisphaerales bacterium]